MNDKDIQAVVWFFACWLPRAPSPSEPQFPLLGSGSDNSSFPRLPEGLRERQKQLGTESTAPEMSASPKPLSMSPPTTTTVSFHLQPPSGFWETPASPDPAVCLPVVLWLEHQACCSGKSLSQAGSPGRALSPVWCGERTGWGGEGGGGPAWGKSGERCVVFFK